MIEIFTKIHQPIEIQKCFSKRKLHNLITSENLKNAYHCHMNNLRLNSAASDESLGFSVKSLRYHMLTYFTPIRKKLQLICSYNTDIYCQKMHW